MEQLKQSSDKLVWVAPASLTAHHRLALRPKLKSGRRLFLKLDGPILDPRYADWVCILTLFSV